MTYMFFSLMMLPVVSFLIMIGKYPAYWRVYKTLKPEDFRSLGDSSDSIGPIIINQGETAWFCKDGTIKVETNNYLHAYLSFINPVQAYWIIKYRRWFKKHFIIST